MLEMYIHVADVFWAIYWYFECFYEVQYIFRYIWTYLKDMFVFFCFRETFEMFEFWNLLFCIKTVLNGPPHPHPRLQQKSPARGQTKLEKQNDDFLFFLWRAKKVRYRGA